MILVFSIQTMKDDKGDLFYENLTIWPSKIVTNK